MGMTRWILDSECRLEGGMKIVKVFGEEQLISYETFWLVLAEIELFKASRRHLPKNVCDIEGWQAISGPAWPKETDGRQGVVSGHYGAVD